MSKDLKNSLDISERDENNLRGFNKTGNDSHMKEIDQSIDIDTNNNVDNTTTSELKKHKSIDYHKGILIYK